MADHDPYCPSLATIDPCACDLIGQVRADQARAGVTWALAIMKDRDRTTAAVSRRLTASQISLALHAADMPDAAKVAWETAERAVEGEARP